jgi:hypothetical protein
MLRTMDRRGEDTVQDAVQDDGRDERLTVAAAAERLGITKEAVRKRIHRGTLRSDRGSDGTVMVYVPASEIPSSTATSADRELLYVEMRERIAYLERQVEEEREARRRADTLLARLMDRMPELEAPPGEPAPSQEPPGGPQSAGAGSNREETPPAGEGPERAEPRPATGGPRDGSERPRDTAEFPVRGSLTRPWWRRVFGG